MTEAETFRTPLETTKSMMRPAGLHVPSDGATTFALAASSQPLASSWRPLVTHRQLLAAGRQWLGRNKGRTSYKEREEVAVARRCRPFNAFS